MITHEAAVQFLQRNPALAKSALEEEAGLPRTTLASALSGRRRLNAEHLTRLLPVLRRYGYREDTQAQARVISVINHKGGVGKTTTTLNLGKALSLLGKRVLLVDMDSQGNLSQALGVDEPGEQVAHALLERKPLPVISLASGLDLAPSDLELAYADLKLVQEVGGVNRLRNALAPLLSRYDYVLIDCPPALNIFTNSALVASHACLVTVQPEASSMKGLNNLFERITQVRDDINYGLTVEGIVLTLVDKRLNVHRDAIDHLRRTLGNLRIFNTQIRQNVDLKESQLSQQDVFTYRSASNGATDYRNLALELMGHSGPGR
jgi:chromosome partitioning protein